MRWQHQLSPKPWQPEAVLQLLLGLSLSLAAGSLALQLGFAVQETQEPSPSVPALLVGVLSFHGVTLILVGWFVRRHQITWREAFGFRLAGLGRALRLAVVVTTLALPVTWSLTQGSAVVMRWMHLEPVTQEAVRTLENADSLAEKLLFGFFAVVAAPFVEESLFRGILYPFVKQVGLPRLALWGTSCLFAFTHANLMTFLPLTVLSVLLTLLYEQTDNLAAPVAAHSLFNLVNLAWLITQ